MTDDPETQEASVSYTPGDITKRLNLLNGFTTAEGVHVGAAEIEVLIGKVLTMQCDYQDIPIEIRGGIAKQVREMYEGVITENVKLLKAAVPDKLKGSRIGGDEGGTWEDPENGVTQIKTGKIGIKVYGNGLVVDDGIAGVGKFIPQNVLEEGKEGNISIVNAQVLYPVSMFDPPFGNQIARLFFR